jgi:phosphopentomutase
MKVIEQEWNSGRDGLFFVNLVDFDTLFGHRRDVLGYACALEEFDVWLASFIPQIERDDLVIFTADHGNDPTFRGTDHTREEVPIWVIDAGNRDNMGVRTTFADVAATIGDFFGVEWETGTSF